MKIVLLSGGSGQRLWPLSNNSRAKQFLKVLDNNDNAVESMVQRVWKQLEAVLLTDKAVIVANQIQKDIIYEQLGYEVPLVLEPERRDTFAAIALASAYLASQDNVSRDEVICVLPVDCYVEDRFFQQLNELEREVLATGADIALIGVAPTYPSSKYGYIVPDIEASSSSSLSVSHFKEKPTEEQARALIEQQALWNCGVFAFSLGYILELLEKNNYPKVYEELSRSYQLLPKNSFDYEVVEKANKVIAISYNGYWKDLGTWNTLTEQIKANKIGNVTISHDSLNSHVINELNVPIILLGVPDVVVVAGEEGILVTDKLASPRLKELLNDYHINLKSD